MAEHPPLRPEKAEQRQNTGPPPAPAAPTTKPGSRSKWWERPWKPKDK